MSDLSGDRLFKRIRGRNKERRGFKCSCCYRWVPVHEHMGTAHRNHCPFCLWSKHVDLKESGDRRSGCQAEMEPIGLTFKQEGRDKYGKMRQGELMVVHKCLGCGKVSINRVAADDDPGMIISVFEASRTLEGNIRSQLRRSNIKLLREDDRNNVLAQLFGKNT